jgi:hypothetical protein
MLREDMNGDFVGDFAFDGRDYEYRVRGYGKPLLMTASISPRYGSYAWRYMFECLAGTRFVYSLDIEGMLIESGKTGPFYYAKLIESFLREIIGVRSVILAGEREFAAVTVAAFEARALVDSMIYLCPGGAGRFRLRAPIIAMPATRKVGIQALSVLRKMTAGARFCKSRRSRTGALPGGKSPARICEDIMRLLK